MVVSPKRMSARTVVVGSGPGGATVARELARRGDDVLILELGAYHKPMGSYVSLFRMSDRFFTLASIEGTQMVRLLTVGGSSIAFLGTAFPPPPWFKSRYGIDLAPYVEDLCRDLPCTPMPERLIGEGAKRIMEAARAEGYDWRPMPHFIHWDKCGSHCRKLFAGSARGVKWTARDYIEDARAHGARLLPKTRVTMVVNDGSKVTGVLCEGPSGRFEVEAERVVLAAGGLGTAPIMQASGFHDAGKGVIIDPLILTYGIGPGRGSGPDVPMGCGTLDLQDEGIVMMDCIDPWPLYLFGLMMGGPKAVAGFRNFPRTLGIMAKTRDQLAGYVRLDGTVSKPLGDQDRALLARAADLSTRILRRAGCDPQSIVTTPPRGAHPAGTVRIGDQLDANLKAPIDGLYVCDSSVLPEPFGMPPVFTILALAKRLVAEQLAPQPRKASAAE
jgi:choline dehydrogenase-like flavoprotein